MPFPSCDISPGNACCRSVRVSHQTSAVCREHAQDISNLRVPEASAHASAGSTGAGEVAMQSPREQSPVLKTHSIPRTSWPSRRRPRRASDVADLPHPPAASFAFLPTAEGRRKADGPTQVSTGWGRQGDPEAGRPLRAPVSVFRRCSFLKSPCVCDHSDTFV